MTQEDKELLLRDLCARLSYGVKIRLQGKPRILFGVQENLIIVRTRSKDCGWEWDEYDIEEWDIKPYLRPMSSMTEEEYESIKYKYSFYGDSILHTSEMFTCGDVTDWLNAHHFDYRGLIEKGLALEAPEDMYNFK